jgi:outer membrane protein insertion porin family
MLRLGAGKSAGEPRGPGLGLRVIALCARALTRAGVAVAAPAVQEAAVEEQAARPVVLGIEVDGERRVSEEQLLSAFGLEVGARYDPAEVNRGVNRLWDTFGVRALVLAEPVEGGVVVRISVAEWPFDPVPRFVGNERVDTEDLLDWAGLEPGAELYRFQIPRVRRALEEGYRREGHYFASVRERLVDRDGGEGVDVVFEIDEGPQVCVEDVLIEGNESLVDRGFLWFRSGLRALARPALRAPRFFGWFGTEFDPRVLEEDLVALRQAYRDQGFLNAVVELARLEFSADREWVTIHLRVDEGERFRVRSLRIQAFDVVPAGPGGALQRRPAEPVVAENELLELCELGEGETYSRITIDRDERALRDRYGEFGHVAHGSMPLVDRWEFLEPDLVYDLENNLVDVTYRLSQGREQRIREVRVQGNRGTRDSVLRRLVTVQPGDLADLPEIDRSLARIRGTGYFSTQFARPGFREPYYRFSETGDPNWKDLDYFVEEGDLIQIDFALQYGADNGAAARVDLRLRNFDISRPPSLSDPFGDIYTGRALRGAGQTFRVSASPGTEVSRYLVSFTEPDLFQRHYDRIGMTVQFGRSFRLFTSHDERRDFAGLSFFRQLDADTRASVGLRTDAVLVDDLASGGEPSLQDPLGVPDLLAQQAGRNRFSALTFGLSHNRLDRPQFPNKGFKLSGDVSIFDDTLGSDAEWFALSADYEHFGRLDEDGSDWGWRLRSNFGTAIPYGDTETLPYTERYFLGGVSVLRGFQFRGVGPIDDGFAIGGETSVTGSVDLFYPLVQAPIPGTFEDRDVLRAGVFADAGILGQGPFEVPADELRMSAGFTIGFLVPIPLTLAFGFPVIEKEGDLRRTFSLSFFI